MKYSTLPGYFPQQKKLHLEFVCRFNTSDDSLAREAFDDGVALGCAVVEGVLSAG
jgi:hypothetical protein